jgi:uncharacterized protein YhaN
LGIPSEDIFKATACVNQGNITHIDNSIEAIKDKLESLVMGNKEDIAGSEAVKKIDDRIIKTTMELVKFNSESDGFDYNITKIQREIEILKTKRGDLVQLETAYKNLCDDLDEKKNKLEQDIRAIEVLDKYKSLEKEYGAIEEKLKRGKELYSNLEKLREQQSEFKKITTDDLKNVEDIESAYQYGLNISKEIGTELSEAKEELSEFKKGIFGILLGVIGVAGVIFSLVSNYITLVEQFTPYIWHSLGGSLLVFLLGMSMYNNKNQIKKRLTHKVEKNHKKFEENNNLLKSNKEKLTGLLNSYKVANSHELRKDFWRYEEYAGSLNKSTTAYTDHMEGETIEALIERFENIKDEFNAIESEYLNIEDNNIDKSGIERDKLIISQLEESKNDLEQERKVLHQKIETAESGSELLASYEERKERHKTKLDGYQREIELLGLTKTCIEEARQNVLVSKLEILNSATSQILSTLTSGKYSEVRFNESDLKFQVLSNEKGDWINPEEALSTSTIEQIYLAARLALTDLISENRNSLLILDEPFSDYDEKRLENAMKVLKNMSEDHQILLLTSKNKYDQWADATITL